MLAPFATVAPLKVHDVAEPTEHELLVYEPESVPFEHDRVCDIHEEPYATEDA